MRTNKFLRRLAAGATVLVVAGAGLLVSEVANAASSGGITFVPTTGTDLTVVAGNTSGPCNVAGSNALQVWVTGPGLFAPNDAKGRPDGVAFRAATTAGFSKTGPVHFTARISFKDFAQELGLTAVPVGDYTVDFRCVDEESLDSKQTYTGKITFTTPTMYTTPSGTPSASGSPSASPSPTSSSTTPSSTTPSSTTPSSTSPRSTTPSTVSDGATTSPPTSMIEGAGTSTPPDPPAGTQPLASTGPLAKTGAPIGLMFLGGLILLAAGLALVVWLRRPRKAVLSDGGDTAGERETGLPDRE